MTKGLQKSSKRKQEVYNKVLKSKSNKNEKKYKTYKSLFETLREKSQTLYFSRKLNSCQQNMKKKSWGTIRKYFTIDRKIYKGFSKEKVKELLIFG